MATPTSDPSVTLDPKSPEEWAEYRAQAHRALDAALDYLERRRDTNAWQAIPGDILKEFSGTQAPAKGAGIETALRDTERMVLPYTLGNTHPGYWGWVNGTGTIGGVLGAMLGATANSPTGGGNHALNHVKKQSIEWLKDMLGFNHFESGIVTSGCTIANLIGLTVARNSMPEKHASLKSVREEGVKGCGPQMTLYCSAETHNSVQKVGELLGFGNAFIRRVPCDNFVANVDALNDMIEADLSNGLLPCAVIANAGTTSTGHVDPLGAIADVCEKHNVWLHVDGAFGAMVQLSDKHKHLVKGMHRADSMAFDLHKWLYVNYEGAVCLIRNAKVHRDAFAIDAAYLQHLERGAGGGDLWYCDYGIELSQSSRALKFWLSIKEHGTDKYAQLIDQNMEQASRIAARVEKEETLETLAPPSLNIVVFRYTKSNHDLNKLNRELLMRLHEGGKFVPSYTSIEGQFGLRVCITNHRTTFDDVDAFVTEVIRLGAQIDAEM